MQLTIKNLTTGTVSLPGPLPRLDGGVIVTIDITPEEFDRYRDNIDTLRNSKLINVLEVEQVSSIGNDFTLDDSAGRLLYQGQQIAPSASIAYGVNTLQELRDIPPENRKDKQLRIVESEKANYYFDAQGSGVDDNHFVIVPTIGTGVWYRTSTSATDPTIDEKNALAGTAGIPSSTNRYVTDGDPRNINDRTASGLRTTSNIVDVSGSPAPVLNQVLTATSGNTATWQDVGIVPLSNNTPLDVDKSPGSPGTSIEASRSDHKHDILTDVPIDISTVNSEGTATSIARSDHVHNHGSLPGGSSHAIVNTTTNGFMSSSDKNKLDGIEPGATNTPLSNNLPVIVSKSAPVAGTNIDVSRSDHRHDVLTAAPINNPIGNAGSEGTATSIARSDHVHPIAAPLPPQPITKEPALAGTSITPSREDHKHDILTAAPNVSIGPHTLNTEGVSINLSRSDHTHKIDIPVQQVNTNTIVTNASITDVLMPDMSIPAVYSGDYVLMFNCDLSGDQNQDENIIISIYVNGAQIPLTEHNLQIRKGGIRDKIMSFQFYLTGILAGQLVEIYWRTVGGNIITVGTRTLTILQVN